MAGHNKWSKVKHIKARVDAIKGRVFSKCAHEITLAARNGGGDISLNPRLRTAIDAAKAVSTPRENIERAIRKGTGELGGDAIQEVSYEGYGPSGTAFIVEMATDNLNRSAQDIRTIFSKAGGSIATQGAVSYQFDRKGEIKLAAGTSSFDKIFNISLECGAEDISDDGDEYVILTAPDQLGTIANHLRDHELHPLSERLVSIPQSPCLVSNIETARQILKLHDTLDEYPDAVNVFTNFEVPDELLDSLHET